MLSGHGGPACLLYALSCYWVGTGQLTDHHAQFTLKRFHCSTKNISHHNDKTVLTSKLKVVNLFEHRAHQCTRKRQETMLVTVHVLCHITCTVGSVCV